MTDERILQVNHLSKSFGKHEVLRDIDFTVNKGDVTSIIGASGSGKSTLLRCINLLETPTSGEIRFHDENILSRKGGAAAYRTKVGMVFQSFNLFNIMLSVMRDLANEGLTMLVVTHEMAFARDVSNHVVFMRDGVIWEEGSPQQIFVDPQREETRDFLSRFMER